MTISLHSISKHPIDVYAQWCMSLWFPSDRLPDIDADVFDHAVMGMGLSGEALETLEAALTDTPLDLDLLLKELGDTLYYWSVSCLRVGLAPSQAWPSHIDYDIAHVKSINPHEIERAAIRCAIASGKCSEAYKKMVRDSADNSRLRDGLPGMALTIASLMQACGFSPRQVEDANREKLSGRIARGTLRGNGNDR